MLPYTAHTLLHFYTAWKFAYLLELIDTYNYPEAFFACNEFRKIEYLFGSIVLRRYSKR